MVSVTFRCRQDISLYLSQLSGVSPGQDVVIHQRQLQASSCMQSPEVHLLPEQEVVQGQTALLQQVDVV